jgi:hypothetical protein
MPALYLTRGSMSDSFISRLKDLTVAPKWDCSPACTELEAVVMDWSAKLFGLDEVFLNEKGIGGGALQVTITNGSPL